MKMGLFLFYFVFSGLSSYGLGPARLGENSLRTVLFLSNLDQIAVKSAKPFEIAEQEFSNQRAEDEKNQSIKEELDQKKLNPAVEKTADQTEQGASSQIITKKIKSIFEDFIKILENRSVESKEYKKAVKFLENSLYNEASFESLELLAQVYEDREDFKNQINVLNILSVNYPKKPESFYLLAMGYKNKYLKVGQEKSIKSSKELLKEKEGYKKEIIKNLNQALKLDSKHIPSYMALLDILQLTDPKTDEKKHTRASLSVVLDMWKSLKQNKYYIFLCKAYYDNQFFKQSLKACARSVKRNPKDPLSPLILSLSLSNEKKKEEKLVLTAQTFPESFFVQYKTGLYFMDKSPRSAILYLTSAHKLEPKHVILNKILAKLLFDNKEEERSYNYFLSSCVLTEGLFLEDFRRAKSSLRRKNKVDLIVQFQKGIRECYQTVKKQKQKKS
ncbi:MAG: hypothetical protein OXJ52_02520 [Oligoflexia bacterium]|nr:hypothetical protein [Oligoflexia bacterium]